MNIKDLKQMRQALNLTLAEAAKKSGITENTIWRMENRHDAMYSRVKQLFDFYTSQQPKTKSQPEGIREIKKMAVNYEYRTLYVSRDKSDKLIDMMNALGREGWHLVSTVRGEYESITHFFKKESNNTNIP